jgi:hypothetical protein
MEIELVEQAFDGVCALLVNYQGKQFGIEIDGPIATAACDKNLFGADDHADVKLRGAV